MRLSEIIKYQLVAAKATGVTFDSKIYFSLALEWIQRFRS